LDVADLLFTRNGAVNYAIPLQSHGVLAGHLYEVLSPNAVLLAGAVLGYPNAIYRSGDPVWIRNAGVTDLASGTVVTVQTGDGLTAARLTVTLQVTAPPDLFAALQGGGFGFQFSSATCGNDVIYGTFPAGTEATPEPGTCILMALGLCGLAFAPRVKT